MAIQYDLKRRIDIAEERGMKGTNAEERLYFLDAADMLRLRERESCPLRYI